MASRRLIRLALISTLGLTVLGLPAAAAGATALVALDLHVSPLRALIGAPITFYGSVTRVSGAPTNVRVSLELPDSYTTGECQPACVDGSRFEWAFSTVTGRSAFTLTTARTGLGETAHLLLAGGNAGCAARCPAAVDLTRTGPTVSSHVRYSGRGPVVSGSTIHVRVRGTTDVAPIDGVLLVELVPGLGIPTNITGGATYDAGFGFGASLEEHVTLAPTAEFEFDVPITAPNGSTLALFSGFTPSLPGDSYVSARDTTVRVGPDADRPTATAPRARLATGSRTGGAPVLVAWSGSDIGTGVDRFVLAKQVDGGNWIRLPGSFRLPRTTLHLAAGHRYRFRVRAVDHADNVGAWVYGSTFTISKVQESSRSIEYQGSWAFLSSPRFWGGHARSGGTDAVARVTTATRSASWVAVRSPTRGVANVFVDGIFSESIDLWAPSLQPPQVVWTASWTRVAIRTVRVKVTERYGGHRVEIDGFYTIR